MSAPTPATRAVVYERDNHRCAACGAIYLLQAQHRQAVGMGGSKARPTFIQLLTLCAVDNAAVEADRQTEALKLGWKVPRWVEHPGMVPVFYVVERHWFRLNRLGTRERISHGEAMRMMHEVYGDQYQEAIGLTARSVTSSAPWLSGRPRRVESAG